MYETKDAGKAQEQFSLGGTFPHYTKTVYNNKLVSVMVSLWIIIEVRGGWFAFHFRGGLSVRMAEIYVKSRLRLLAG